MRTIAFDLKTLDIGGYTVTRTICILLAASTLTLGAAYGQNTNQSTAKHSKAQAISDTQMDKVTAGATTTSQPAGGAIATNGSNVTTSSSGTVNLSGTAMEGAQGINVVSASNSSVGDGVNVWDGSLSTVSNSSSSTVNQGNEITQSSTTSGASLDGYKHGANTMSDNTQSSTSTKTNNSSLSVVGALNHQRFQQLNGHQCVFEHQLGYVEFEREQEPERNRVRLPHRVQHERADRFQQCQQHEVRHQRIHGERCAECERQQDHLGERHPGGNRGKHQDGREQRLRYQRKRKGWFCWNRKFNRQFNL